MRVKELQFELPTRLLATRPRELAGERRDNARLLVLCRKTGGIEHRRFHDLVEYVNPGDTIILNDSRTINAHLFGDVEGLGRLEFQLRCYKGAGVWQAECRPWRDPVPGARINFGPSLTAVVEGIRPEIPLWIMRFPDRPDFEDLLAELGRPIMSPYVDRVYGAEFYNTVYARTPGSAEMPAAGRHFTPELLDALTAKGVRMGYITLHTGLSSIDIQTEDVEKHKMLEEWYSVPEETSELLTETKKAGTRVFIVGTTVMRCLESAAGEDGRVAPGDHWTNLYIYPGYRFKVADAFITNFHGPKSTRIALAAAFAGTELVLQGYRQAIEREYLFYEFGDATLTI